MQRRLGARDVEGHYSIADRLSSIVPFDHAAACPSLDSNGEAFSLKTRKPVLGDNVHLGTTFGMRIDPILNTRRMHPGVAWLADRGTPVVAASAGKVLSASVMGEYGNTVIIDHGGGWHTLYAHLERLQVKEGDCVEALMVIAAVGSTGLVAGPRLYF